uniref:Uncharacterized protein n=1 Tax=Rhizophora mucronata TaxID=61149 RepID=A0A2P2QS05_RHIMU
MQKLKEMMGYSAPLIVLVF